MLATERNGTRTYSESTSGCIEQLRSPSENAKLRENGGSIITVQTESVLADGPVEELELDGNSLTLDQLVACGLGKYRIKLSDVTIDKIQNSANTLAKHVDEERITYGVTTGFGNFANVAIPMKKLKELQYNLIRSHACGVGTPLPPYQTRMLLALRINVLAKGYSGISVETLTRLIEAFNAYCVSKVPQKGTVGCSGDLCPLAHLALGLLGEGEMWSPETGWSSAEQVLQIHNLKPLNLQPKEGLALINGTQMVSALGAEAVTRAKAIALQADVIAALTLEALKANTKPFDEAIHRTRPHKGQLDVAQRLRKLLPSDTNPSAIADDCSRQYLVQDAYAIRCIPQVHGIVHDTIAFVHDILTTEINSATDNPLVFEDGRVMSCGNFHGEYPAKVLDYLAIAVHELAQISERRLERLINKALSNGLPMFLCREGGLNSGYMMIQVTAASLVSENKVLCHPSSVDSITTSAAQEDHVSMGGFAARKALGVVKNVEHVMATELLAACEGLEFLRPLTPTEPLKRVYDLVRTVSKPLGRDRSMAPDIEMVAQLLRDQKVWSEVAAYLNE